MTTFICDVNSFKFFVADDTQVIGDFSRDYRRIFINGEPLEKIFQEMQITVNYLNPIQKRDLVRLWNEYCFKDADEKHLPSWRKFANALFHQGGLLYGFESILNEKMSLPDNNSKAFFPKSTEKEVHIGFDKHKQVLTIQEKCFFTEIKDPEEQNHLVAKKGDYLIKAQLTHYISLFEEKEIRELKFWHGIVQPEFECKNPVLQKCLNQRKISIMEAIKNWINEILTKLFQLEFEPNKASFFQKPCYQNQINQNQIIMKEDSCNLLKNHYTKIAS